MDECRGGARRCSFEMPYFPSPVRSSCFFRLIEDEPLISLCLFASLVFSAQCCNCRAGTLACKATCCKPLPRWSPTPRSPCPRASPSPSCPPRLGEGSADRRRQSLPLSLLAAAPAAAAVAAVAAALAADPLPPPRLPPPARRRPARRWQRLQRSYGAELEALSASFP